MYDHWIRRLPANPVDEKAISVHEVVRAHFLIADYFSEGSTGIGGVGPRDLNLLCSAVDRQFTQYAGIRKWTNEFEKCATLMYGLVQDHPFHDANKRTALLTTLYFLQKNNRVPSVGQRDLEDLVVEVASSDLESHSRYRDMTKSQRPDAEVRFVADYLKRNTRKVDRTSHTITYKDLQRILAKFSAGLESPSGNYIDVVRYDSPNYLSRVFGRKERKVVRVTRVGFPGWKNQVFSDNIKLVRDALDLTVKHGVDSATFFGNADPLNMLIVDYAGPLRRLADR